MRRLLRFLFILTVQSIAGLLLGFAAAYTLGFGRGRELLIIALGNTLGVWGSSTVTLLYGGDWPSLASLGATVAGAFLGVLLIVVTPPFGFMALLLPLAGALLGYYLAAFWPTPRPD